MEPDIRIIRVLEYVGPRAVLEDHLRRRWSVGFRQMSGYAINELECAEVVPSPPIIADLAHTVDYETSKEIG